MESEATADLAVILLLPDMMRLDLWDRFARHVAALGATAIGAIPTILSAATHAELYREALATEAGPERLPARWLLPQLVALDMSLAVILRRERAGLLADLGARKGSAAADDRRAGTLRADAPLAERGLSLVHVADSPTEMARQAAVLLPGVDLGLLARQPGRMPRNPSELAALRGHVALAAEMRRDDLPLRLLRRALLTLLWDPRLLPDPAVAAAAALLDSPADDRRATLAAVDALLRTAEAPAFALGLDDDRLGRPLEDRHWSLVEVARTLARPDRLTMVDGPRLADLLARHGLFLDPWERHCLSVFCAFPSS